MSPVVTKAGSSPTANVVCAVKLAVVAPGAVVLRSTDTVPDGPKPPTIRSGRPSPLRSAAVTPVGVSPTANVCCASKVGAVAPGAVVFSSTDTEDDPRLETIKSFSPSPLRSAVVTEYGCVPTVKGAGAAKLGNSKPDSVALLSARVNVRFGWKIVLPITGTATVSVVVPGVKSSVPDLAV